MLLFIASAYMYCFLVKDRKCKRPNRDKPSICFSGCGFRYHFYGGVAEYLLDNFETDNIDILCVSGSIYASTILALQDKLTDWSERDWPACYDYLNNRWLYAFLDTQCFHRNIWLKYLPPDAYKKCSDRLFITVSRLGFYGFYEEIVSQYGSNDELIDALCGTSHFIGLHRILPRVHGKYAFDGCYTNLTPQTICPKGTLFVKLFGRGHIDYGNKLSLSKIITIVKPEHCNTFINEGYEIASRHHQTFIDCGFVEKKCDYI
jgi:hypothetical protein